jgi:hypothetical protein
MAKEPNEQAWWQLLWLLAQGWRAGERSRVTSYRACWIGLIAKHYNEDGPAGMVQQHSAHYNPTSGRVASQSWRCMRLFRA